jgi:hypothetical protein
VALVFKIWDLFISSTCGMRCFIRCYHHRGHKQIHPCSCVLRVRAQGTQNSSLLIFHTHSRIFKNIQGWGELNLNFSFYSYVHTMFGSFLPPSPLLLPPSHPSSLPSRNYFALISNFVEERV